MNDQGFVRVIYDGSLNLADDADYFGQPHVAVKNIEHIIKVEDADKLWKFLGDSVGYTDAERRESRSDIAVDADAHLNIVVCRDSTCAHDSMQCSYIANMLPCYWVIVINKYGKNVTGTKEPITNYIVHPCERERMERILQGTHNPLYDLLHELRYNPAFGLGAELAQAREHFGHEKKKRPRVDEK